MQLSNLFTKAGVLALAATVSASPVPELETRGLSGFEQQMLDAQNWYRSQHSASPLSWDYNLASNAQYWANQCTTGHQPNNYYGENVAWGSGWASNYDWANIWGSERVSYDFNNPGYSGYSGHFTQVVWKGSRSVGCAWASCAFGYNVVCEYDPYGNVMGEFWNNVGNQVSGWPSDEYWA